MSDTSQSHGEACSQEEYPLRAEINEILLRLYREGTYGVSFWKMYESLVDLRNTGRKYIPGFRSELVAALEQMQKHEGSVSIIGDLSSEDCLIQIYTTAQNQGRRLH